MWRVLLVATGSYAGYRLAKMGESRYNFIIATVAAALVYKFTRERMIANGEVSTAEANAAGADIWEPNMIRDVEVEMV